MFVYMSGPKEAVERNAYTHGPAPWYAFHPDPDDIIVVKNLRGETIRCEDWEGNSLPIPASHKLGGYSEPASSPTQNSTKARKDRHS